MHFLIHNSFHSGDVLLTRLIITAIMENFPDVRITLECQTANQYLWEDLGLPIVSYDGREHTSTMPTPNCPSDAIFLNLWFGFYGDILDTYGLTYENNVHTFNRQMEFYHLRQFYQLSVPRYPPALTFARIPEIPFRIEKNSILIENGVVHSAQSYFPMNDHLEIICKTFPQFTFYCSAKPPFNAPNLVDCSQCNLLQLSEISNYCKAFITLGSGVNAATYTEENLVKPRCLVGIRFSWKIWGESDYPVFYADGLSEVCEFIERLI